MSIQTIIEQNQIHYSRGCGICYGWEISYCVCALYWNQSGTGPACKEAGGPALEQCRSTHKEGSDRFV